MRSVSWNVAMICLLAAALAPGVARPDAASEARLRDALRAATAKAQALEDEKTRWQEAEAALKKEVEELKRRPAPKDPGDRKAAELQRRLTEQAEGSARLKASLDQCQAAAKDAAEEARAAGQERTHLATESTALQARLAAAEARNAGMYRVAREVLDWIDDLGPGTAYEARDPFLGLKRVELENVAQDYRDKLLEQKAKAAKE
jgi:chromosome segregation ATPase